MGEDSALTVADARQVDEMRLLYVIDSLAPGGAETSLLEMAPGMVRDGIDLHVLPLGRSRELAGPLQAAGAVVHARDLPAGRLNNVLEVIRVGRDVRPDLVHTTLFEADVAGRIGARLLRVPSTTSLVTARYGSQGAGSIHRMKLGAVRSLDLVTGRLARRFHAVSTAVAESIGPTLRIDGARIEVIPRGREPQRFRFRSETAKLASRERLDLDPETKVVLVVGRVEPDKGIGDLLDALPAVASMHEQTLVLIAGRDGLNAASLRDRAEQAPLEVRFLGHRPDVPDLMAAADVLAFPSHREGSPGALIEAMAVGIPIVSSDIAPCVEVLGPPTATALTVPVGEADALAAALNNVLSHPGDAQTRALAARERFEEFYTIDAVTHRMVAFFKRAAY